MVADFISQPASTPNVTEKEREAANLAFLDQICGPGDQVLSGFLFEIAQGSNGRDVVKGDRLVTVYPSANERTNAARLLRVWHRGLAQRSLKVDQTVTHRLKWDPNKLTLEQLEALQKAHEQAALPSGDTVDGKFTETDASTSEPVEEEIDPSDDDPSDE